MQWVNRRILLEFGQIPNWIKSSCLKLFEHIWIPLYSLFFRQSQWRWIVPHQISLSIAFIIFFLDLMLLTIGASFTNKFRIIRYIYDWLEIDDEEITTYELFRSYITSAIFTGLLYYILNGWILEASLSLFNVSVLSGCALHSLFIESCSLNSQSEGSNE